MRGSASGGGVHGYKHMIRPAALVTVRSLPFHSFKLRLVAACRAVTMASSAPDTDKDFRLSKDGNADRSNDIEVRTSGLPKSSSLCMANTVSSARARTSMLFNKFER